ncbi:MAG: NADH:ubiquinone oxidoreductase [Chlorobiaceae bacterium]|nr:NADH:ubiquinone oxidoreductase [Chlorobiaceae bacterium]NTW11167.1 NADH:ubiquinone oxidoreductase [Chlorobiaceae bacterium]
MNHLGFKIDKVKIGSFDFTCCEGCQLQLANKESTLPAFLGLLDIRNFREISSERHDDYDIALVEGSITRSDEIERLKAIRAQAKVLVAFGSCACFGGVNSLKNKIPAQEAIKGVYGDKKIETMPSTKISDIVSVDLMIPGCPVSKEEVERVVVGVVTRSLNNLPKYPVCVDCKQKLNTCLFDLGEVCLGPVTKAGCDAVCPSGKTACLGCRGPADDMNFPSFLALVREKGLCHEEMMEKLTFYNGFADYLDHES